MASYSLDSLTLYVMRRLDLNVEEKKDVVQGMIISCLRKLPIRKFLIKDKVVDLKAVQGRIDLPLDVYELKGEHPYLLSWSPDMDYLPVPEHIDTMRIRYDALPSDADGLPIIPDVLDECIIKYIEAEYLMRAEWRMARRSRADYQYALRDFENEVAESRGRLNKLTEAEWREVVLVKTKMFYVPRNKTSLHNGRNY